MRFELNFENKRVSYGIDTINGVFLQIENGENVYNWSEFHPIQKRLTYASNFEIKQRLTQEEYKLLKDAPLVDDSLVTGSWSINFMGIYGSTKHKDMEEYWDKLISEPHDPFEVMKYNYFSPYKSVKTMGDYFKVLRLYRWPVFYKYATWYDGLEEQYHFVNDLTEREERENSLIFCMM